MNDFTQPSVSVAGAGVAELPVPLWARALKVLIPLGVFKAVVSVGFAAQGWNWVASGFTAETSAHMALVITFGAAVAIATVWLGLVNKLLNIRKKNGRLVFGGFYKKRQSLWPLLILAALFAIPSFAITYAVMTCPLPQALTKVNVEVPPPTGRLSPIYFWDYATFIDPQWLDTHNLVLPYERGLPKRLLPKFYFQDVKKQKIAVELHGKRPRTYDQQLVHEVFNDPVVHPRNWPLLWKLQKEAGLITDGVQAATLYLLRLHQPGTSNVTQAIGVPWPYGDGRVFFWGPDGGVFQVKCQAPCDLARMLELVQFPQDPKGSHASRLAWTKGRIRELLAQPMPTEHAAKARHENFLSLYLVSLLTLDPRDPEAFFHIGKLAKNRETAISAARYGRDLGLEPVKILELEATAERLGF